jgi:hypothetical protein
VRVYEPQVVDFAAAKAGRQAAEAETLARLLASDPWPSLLVGHAVTVRRPSTIEWLRATPVAEWPALRVGLAFDGATWLVDGNHRIAVARALGVNALPARVRAGGRVVHDGLVGV